jgi:hypothetical protein
MLFKERLVTFYVPFGFQKKQYMVAKHPTPLFTQSFPRSTLANLRLAKLIWRLIVNRANITIPLSAAYDSKIVFIQFHDFCLDIQLCTAA